MTARAPMRSAAGKRAFPRKSVFREGVSSPCSTRGLAPEPAGRRREASPFEEFHIALSGHMGAGVFDAARRGEIEAITPEQFRKIR